MSKDKENKDQRKRFDMNLTTIISLCTLIGLIFAGGGYAVSKIIGMYEQGQNIKQIPVIIANQDTIMKRMDVLYAKFKTSEITIKDHGEELVELDRDMIRVETTIDNHFENQQTQNNRINEKLDNIVSLVVSIR